MTAANNSFGVAEFEGQTFLASDIAKFSQARSAFCHERLRLFGIDVTSLFGTMPMWLVLAYGYAPHRHDDTRAPLTSAMDGHRLLFQGCDVGAPNVSRIIGGNSPVRRQRSTCTRACTHLSKEENEWRASGILRRNGCKIRTCDARAHHNHAVRAPQSINHAFPL